MVKNNIIKIILGGCLSVLLISISSLQAQAEPKASPIDLLVGHGVESCRSLEPQPFPDPFLINDEGYKYFATSFKLKRVRNHCSKGILKPNGSPRKCVAVYRHTGSEDLGAFTDFDDRSVKLKTNKKGKEIVKIRVKCFKVATEGPDKGYARNVEISSELADEDNEE